MSQPHVDTQLGVPTVSSERFYTRNSVRWFGEMAVLCLAMAALSAWQYYRNWDPLEFIIALGVGLISVLTIIGYWNRNRPIVEVSDERVTYGNIAWPWTRSVELSEVVEVGPIRGMNRTLRLRTSSGSVFKVHLLNIAKESRSEVKAAIERRIGRDQRPEEHA